MDEFVRRFLAATGDVSQVATDAEARYYGAVVDDRSLTPDNNPRLGPTRFDDWLAQHHE
jgi:hypothetical protein